MINTTTPAFLITYILVNIFHLKTMYVTWVGLLYVGLFCVTWIGLLDVTLVGLSHVGIGQ